jgi:large subunit ribosomal protein L37e
MVKGTTSFGKHGKKAVHTHCRRCGRRAYHIRQKRCAACGYGASKTIRKYAWQTKTLNRERAF